MELKLDIKAVELSNSTGCNRTSMELKPYRAGAAHDSATRCNRTTMELKLLYTPGLRRAMSGCNRTTMELKHDGVIQGDVIVPLWN